MQHNIHACISCYCALFTTQGSFRFSISTNFPYDIMYWLQLYPSVNAIIHATIYKQTCHGIVYSGMWPRARDLSECALEHEPPQRYYTVLTLPPLPFTSAQSDTDVLIINTTHYLVLYLSTSVVIHVANHTYSSHHYSHRYVTKHPRHNRVCPVIRDPSVLLLPHCAVPVPVHTPLHRRTIRHQRIGSCVFRHPEQIRLALFVHYLPIWLSSHQWPGYSLGSIYYTL